MNEKDKIDDIQGKKRINLIYMDIFLLSVDRVRDVKN